MIIMKKWMRRRRKKAMKIWTSNRQQEHNNQHLNPMLSNIYQRRKKSIENSIRVANVMEEICQEPEGDMPSQSSAVASLPASVKMIAKYK